MTKEEALAYKMRWEAVNAFEREELRNTPVHIKLQQLAALMSSVKVLGWHSALSEGEDELRARWNHLRKLYNVF